MLVVFFPVALSSFIQLQRNCNVSSFHSQNIRTRRPKKRVLDKNIKLMMLVVECFRNALQASQVKMSVLSLST